MDMDIDRDMDMDIDRDMDIKFFRFLSSKLRF
jgi:hypothetical protein